jgi:cyanate lyase
MTISTKVRERMVAGLKAMLPIITQLKARDVSEADTVTLVKEVLQEVFGYDKFAELTSEHAIQGRFCDIAIKVDDKLIELVEVKAIGLTLSDKHLGQVVDYAANQPVDWVILTNGSVWRLYEILFGKPIDKRVIAEVDVMQIDVKKEDSVNLLYLFTKEALTKGAVDDFRDLQDATSRFTLAALLLNNDHVVSTIRSELRKVVDVLVDADRILKVLREDVIKRDVLEGANAERATRQVKKKAAHPSKSSNGEDAPQGKPEPADAGDCAAPVQS